MKYLQLHCHTCNETFKPVIATTPNELLYPDYEQCEEQASKILSDSLRSFHWQHLGHNLEEVEVEIAA